MPPVDITFTVKASIANGRRLMKNDDGSTFWEGDEPVPEGYFDGPPNPSSLPIPDLVGTVTDSVVTHGPKSRAKKRLLHG